MNAELTPEEQKQLEAVRAEYNRIQAELQPLTDWEREHEGQEIPPEVAAALDTMFKAAEVFYQQRAEILEAAEDRHMKSLGHSPADILEDGKQRAREYAAAQYRNQESPDLDVLRGVLDVMLKRHYDALQKYPVQLEDLKKHAGDVLKVKPADRLNPWASKTDNFLIAADNITRELFNNPAIKTGQEYAVTALRKRGSRDEITSVFQIDIDKLGPGVKIQGEYLKGIDEPIFGAYLSLTIKDNYSVITPGLIHDKLTNSSGAGLTPEKAAEYMLSFERMEKCHVTIDATEEMQIYYPDIENWKQKGRMLPVEFVDVKMGKHEVKGIKPIGIPLIYRYDALKKQISSIPAAMLGTPGQNTEEKILIQYYLIKRVEGARLGNLTPVILYETIYNQVQITQETPGAIRKKQHKIREQAKSILDHWVKLGRIKGYEERKKGRVFEALVLIMK